MEEDMMMPNVAPAPMMIGTPMGGDLSAPMAPAQAELSPAEMQEAQGALMQIIQIIQMLVNQGMSEEEIQQFLAQYGITEEELDQAAAILGVDIDALMAGKQRLPMAAGGPSTPQQMFNALPKVLQGGLKIAKDDPSYLVDSNKGDNAFGPNGEIIGDLINVNAYISNLPNKYNNLLKKKESLNKLKRQNLATSIFDLPASFVFPEGTSFGNKIRIDRAQRNKAQKDMELLPSEQEFIENYESYFGLKKERMPMAKGGMPEPLDANPRPDFPLGNIDALKFEIAKLERAYQNALDNNNFVEAQRIANEIDKAQQDIIENQDKLPLSKQAAAIEGFNMPMPVAGLNMRFGGSATGK